ncbi:3'-5' exonuclease [soil metagenome]
MDKPIEVTDILFLDIETISCNESYKSLDERLKLLWNKKAQVLKMEDIADPEEFFFNRAGIYAEFGKIITIAVGFLYKSEEDYHLKVKAFTSENEKDLLLEFKELIEKKYKNKELYLCAHNGKEFDIPYICRRMICNHIPLPEVLDISGKKPWEVKHLDTLEMWKFGDRKNYTSLELLAALFDIESSKDGIDGSIVNQVYYLEKDLNKIAKYCKADVVVTANLYLRMKCLPKVTENNIHIL